MKKGLITIAVGKKYNKYAKYLAYSCILHSPAIIRAIITDNCEYFKGLYDIIIEYKQEMGDPFYVKLNLQHYSPFYETLFIDADAMVYNDLHFMWDYFKDRSIVYNGAKLKEGNWYVKDVSKTLELLDIPWLGQLNSGIFLFKKDETGIKVLNYAAELHTHHEGIEIPFFRGKMLPDEPFLAIAFGKYNVSPIEEKEDFGRLGRSLMNPDSIYLDITKGISRYTRNGHWVFPSVVHFTGSTIGDMYYKAERIRLFFYFNGIPGKSIINIFLKPFLFLIKIMKPYLKFLFKRN